MINSDSELLERVENAIHKAQINGDNFIQEMGYIIGILSEKTCLLSKKIRDDFSIISYNKQDYNRSFDHSVESMRDISWSEEECKRFRFNQHFSIDNISERYLDYNPDIVASMVGILLKNRKKKVEDKRITITMTSCKRYDLFYKTVSSFINCCLDIHLIDEWIVVDDNSSDEDKLKMITDFPFIKYIWKTKENKGHPRSMNIIREMVETPYVFHIEDDWLFFRKENYITICLSIIEDDKQYGQCLLNRLYGERSRCHDIVGGIRKFCKGIRYYEHEFYTGDELDEFKKRNINQKHCAYWPHYSLRVGMMKTEVWKNVGMYDEKSQHFEMDYAYRYVNKGYKTVFMDNIYCLHIGRCTFERGSDKLNAYDLNSESQFGEPLKEIKNNSPVKLGLTEEEKLIPMYFESEEDTDYNGTYRMKTYVLNLKRRPDRLKQFVLDNHNELEKLQYEFFEAIDGKAINPKPKTLKLFETGDYNYRKGILGCASSHIKMWHELIISPDLDVMLIIEDDTILSKNFIDKLVFTLRKLPHEKWDILFLGHFLYPQYRKENDREDKLPIVEQWNKQRCMTQSMGGTIGYVIHKRGAVNMFKHIHEKGMYNAVDWVMFKTADINNIYYCYPHIVFSECVTNDIKPDSDIQYDKYSLCPNDDIRLLLEINYWIEQLKQSGVKYINDKLSIKENNNSKILYTISIPKRDDILSYVSFIKSNNYMDVINKLEKLPVQYYTLNGKYVVVVPHTKINNIVLEDVIFDGGYLNIDHPI